MSNFLGDVEQSRGRSAIISAAELIAREGINPQKSMNFRDGELLPSVFLVLERENGFRDEWDAEKKIYVYEGHDSTTVEAGKLRDQVAMYESGKLSDNGRFFKAAQEFVSGDRKEPLAVQVYEKIDAGTWFDKGVFELVDAAHIEEDARKVYKFYLRPTGLLDSADEAERTIAAATKAAAWAREQGRCEECGSEQDLYFVDGGEVRLLCAAHGGRTKVGFL